jgi:uncharacterized protein (DUF849 family)
VSGDGFIVNVCLTGMVASKGDNPNVPTTPEEIAADCERCADVGASIFHVHARDEAGDPDWRAERYGATLRAIRARCPDAVLCVSTSGRRHPEPQRRAAALDATPRPDMASLTLGSVNFLRGASINDPDLIERLASAMAERGIRPELEIFDVGMARTASRLAERGVLQPPLYANVLLGNAASAGTTPPDLAAILASLPPDTIWSAGGIGRSQLPAAALGLVHGHGVRIGLEDNIRYPDGSPADNPGLVERAVAFGRLLGREPLPAEDIRRRLGLGPPSAAE